MTDDVAAPPLELDESAFEALVVDELDALPDEMVDGLDNVIFVTEARPEDAEVMTKFSVNPPNVYGFGHQAYYDHIVACLRDGVSASVDGAEGRKSLELINAIYESIETGREVHLRFTPKNCRLGGR